MPKFDLNDSPNSQMIKSVQTKSVREANAKVVQNIPVELIDENPDNRSVFNMDEIERLALNIKEEGFFGTIEVYQKVDGRYEISSGHRRFQAVKSLGMTTIPATVSALPETDTKKRRKLIASNINTRNMMPLDWARAIQYHYDTLMLEDAEKKGKETVDGKRYKASTNRLDEVAEYFGLNVVTIIRYMKLTKLIPELTDLLERKICPWTSLCGAGDLSEADQREVYKKLMFTYENAVPTKDENDNEKRVLSGVQVDRAIKNVKESKRIIEDAKVISEDEPKISIKHDVILRDAEEEIGNAIISDSPAVATKTVVDGVLSSLSFQLQRIASGDFRIGKPDEVERVLSEIEKNIQKIRDRI